MKSIIQNEFSEHLKTSQAAMNSLCGPIEVAAKICINSLKSGGKILLFGNGGSAADAQHLATELMGGMSDHDRMPIPSIALTTDSSFITAWSNDTDFESIFSRQIQGLGKEGDVLVGISTSGNSKNIINAIKQAKYKKLSTIAFTGKSGGNLDGIADITLKVPSGNTQRIQESHIMIGQILCSLVELYIMKK
jgi:D-sedoheptulose 7-phosphate isomerase